MSSIRRSNVAADTANALDGLRFQDLPPGGALVTLYGSSAVAGGLISFGDGDGNILVDGYCNTEIVADAVDTGRDLLLDREPMEGGAKLFLATATQVVNFLLVIEALPAGR